MHLLTDNQWYISSTLILISNIVHTINIAIMSQATVV